MDCLVAFIQAPQYSKSTTLAKQPTNSKNRIVVFTGLRITGISPYLLPHEPQPHLPAQKPPALAHATLPQPDAAY